MKGLNQFLIFLRPSSYTSAAIPGQALKGEMRGWRPEVGGLKPEHGDQKLTAACR